MLEWAGGGPERGDARKMPSDDIRLCMNMSKYA